MKTWLHRVIYGGSSLRPYEMSCLAAFGAALPDDGRAILDTQLRAVDMIQRFADDKLAVVYFHTEAIPLFPNHSEELTSAVVSLSADGHLKCRIVLHRGRLSSLEFSNSPKVLRDTVNHASARLIADVMCGDTTAVSPLSPHTTHLRVLRDRLAIRDVIPPAKPEVRELFLKALDVVVPDDYADLLAECDGFVAQGWVFLGTRARRVVLPLHTYVLAAETKSSDKALGFRAGAVAPMTVLYDQIDDDDIDLGPSFVEALLSTQ